MKRLCFALWLFVPAVGYGQSTLNFPKAFSVSELASTGFAIVNPGSTVASTTFTLRSSAGIVLAADQREIPPGGQLARLGSELFPGTSEAGWVQVSSPSTGLTGFFLTGDFTTLTDGADPAPVAGSLVLPLVSDDTEINVANNSLTPATVTLSLRRGDGAELGASSENIASRGVFQGMAADVFPGADVSQATHILITGGFAISATALVRDFLVSPSLGAVNGVPLSSPVTELNFPHVISGSLGGSPWLTAVGVTNLASAANTVRLTFRSQTGSSTTVERTLAAFGSIRESAEDLFGFSSDVFQDGWVQVSSTSGEPITGFLAYANTAAGGMAVVPVLAEPLSALIFAHVAQQEPWRTGVALVNTTDTAVNVEVFVLNIDGDLVGGAHDSPDAAFTLEPGAKVARLISEWIPKADINGGFVFVRTTNDVPLYGLELFFLNDLVLLSNVAPGGLAQGVVYAPPIPDGSITLKSISPPIVSRGDVLTLSGNGFASDNVVVFPTGSGATSQDPETVSSATLTVTVPADAISGPVFVQSPTAASPSQIVQVTSGSELVQTPVTVAAGQITGGVDIYVPVAAGSVELNLTGVGSGDRSQGINAAASSVPLSRGQTTDLLVLGTGFSQNNGSNLTVTGEGVTLSDFAFVDGAMFVEVRVSPSALLGPRSLVLTNSNFDTTVLSGGIIVTD